MSKSVWAATEQGFRRVIAPLSDYLVARRVNPNVLTTVGTLCACTAGIIFATGHISIAGWTLGLTATMDFFDGEVARRTGQSTVFGAFYDSTLDRIADGFVLGGLTFFYASNTVHHSLVMVVILLAGLLGTFVTSYTRSRAETLGVPMKGVGMMERAERIVLLSAPQAFFGLALNGWVLRVIITFLCVAAVITAGQRILHVARVTGGTPLPPPSGEPAS
ncbi:MAG: CDP-alcohol phosphatidyltransferase family protein [Gemmatimonadaceae bacterium]|nr:CDP-alcohol phosphatidyltransferase family protein [Gemmatimonadaceae bacterium]